MSRPSKSKVSALTIAGSDSGGGAGIQADLKTFAAHGVHGLSALAALTAQNTQGVTAIHVPDVGFLRAQLEAVLADFQVAAIKLGMLADRAVIEAVAELLERVRVPIVVDPVMIATSGARLLAADALDALKTRLLPLATVLTPNLPEAELLVGHSIADPRAAQAALSELLQLGPRAVLLKGGHAADGGPVIDLFGQESERASFEHARFALSAHGTGCTLSAAIAANLAHDIALASACEQAVDYVHGALRHAYFPGRTDLAVLDHMWRTRASASQDD